MLHAVLEARILLAMATAACVGTWGLYAHPVQPDNPFLALIQLERPFVFKVLSYGYATLWFTTPFLAASVRLAQAVTGKQNILISGGTGTGKTTLLNALAARIPDDERVIVIEETSEIHLEKPNLLRFEARRAQLPLGQETPLPPVTIADLVRASLRHRPDRILVGEVRGPEAF